MKLVRRVSESATRHREHMRRENVVDYAFGKSTLRADASAQFVERVEQSCRNVCQPNHVLAK